MLSSCFDVSALLLWTKSFQSWCGAEMSHGLFGVALLFVEKSSVASESALELLQMHLYVECACARVLFSPCLHVSPMPFLWKSNSAAATGLHIPSSFDSIRSDLCIISLLPYANLAGPKYCSLTNPSFVFSRHTKHQSCFSTHATPTKSRARAHALATPLRPPWKQGAVWNWKLAD